MALSVAVCEIFSVKEWCDLENRVSVRSTSLEMAPFDRSQSSSYPPSIVTMAISCINVKNFHGRLTTVVTAQNDTSKTANITDTERLISPIFKTPSLVRAIPVFYRKWYVIFAVLEVSF